MTNAIEIEKMQQAAQDAFILLYQQATNLSEDDTTRTIYLMSMIHMLTRKGFKACKTLGMPHNETVYRHVITLLKHETETNNESH